MAVAKETIKKTTVVETKVENPKVGIVEATKQKAKDTKEAAAKVVKKVASKAADAKNATVKVAKKVANKAKETKDAAVNVT
jgi:hypothetical protein